MKRRQKAGFLRPRRKGGEEKKSNGCSLSFYDSYFGVFGRKKLSDAKGPSGDNIFKNRARDCQTPVYHTQILEKLDLPGTNLFEGIRLSPQTSKFPCANE